MSLDDERPLTVREVAQRWRCSEQHVRELCRSRELNSFRLGARIRIPARAVAEMEGAETEHETRGWERGLERVRKAAARK